MNPNGKGGFRPGQSGNPGGRSAEEIRAAKWLNEQLRSPEMLEAGLSAYLQLLKERNPTIVRDFADRVGGKAVEKIELARDLAGSMEGLSAEKLHALLRALRETPPKTASSPESVGPAYATGSAWFEARSPRARNVISASARATSRSPKHPVTATSRPAASTAYHCQAVVGPKPKFAGKCRS